MNAKKGSKNSIDNRGAKSLLMCKTCNTERKAFRIMAPGINQMGFECKCGLSDKAGNKI